jgi:hypothetical protein
MSEIKGLLIGDCISESIIFYCPIDVNNNLLSEMKNIFISYKEIRKEKGQYQGNISSGIGHFYYYSYPSNIFYVVNSIAQYEEKKIKEMILKIETEFNNNKNYFERNLDFKSTPVSMSTPTVSLNRQGKEFVFKIFEIYKSSGNNSNEIDISLIDVSQYFSDASLKETERPILIKQEDNSFVHFN